MLIPGHTFKPAAFLRSQLALLLTLIFSLSVAPQAVAQCGPNITLTANQWSMVGVPCQPGPSNTIEDIFGPSLNATDYAVTWIVWKRIYDAPAQCSVASGPADCYIKLTLTDTVNTGDAFWIFTTVSATLNLGAVGASDTPGPQFQFPATLSTDGSSRYYLFANPYKAAVIGPDLVFPTALFGIFAFTASVQQAINFSIISQNVHYWNGNTYFTEDITTNAATFVPKQAAWLEMRRPNPGFIPFSDVRVPDPGAP